MLLGTFPRSRCKQPELQATPTSSRYQPDPVCYAAAAAVAPGMDTTRMPWATCCWGTRTAQGLQAQGALLLCCCAASSLQLGTLLADVGLVAVHLLVLGLVHLQHSTTQHDKGAGRQGGVSTGRGE